MLGAIIGDIVGSRFEFNNYYNKHFDLFTEKCFFTDDSIMTAAIAKALADKKSVKKTIIEYGQTYPYAGYGSHFRQWLLSEDHKPYNSCGNGAAMRISPVAYAAKSEEEVKELSKKVTAITHNHPEGIKGAEVTAMCIYKALHGESKKDIEQYAIEQYPEITKMDYLWLNHNYKWGALCQNTVPQAIFCFLISNDFEDCIRTTISIGGDSDTLCAISGAIAEAYYGIPKKIKEQISLYFRKKDKEFLLKPLNKLAKQYGIDKYIDL